MFNIPVNSRIMLDTLKIKCYQQNNDFEKIINLINSYNDEEKLIKVVIMLSINNYDLNKQAINLIYDNNIELDQNEQYYNKIMSNILKVIYKEIVSNNKTDANFVTKIEQINNDDIQTFISTCNIISNIISSYVANEEHIITEEERTTLNHALEKDILSIHIPNDIKNVIISMLNI